MNLKLDQFFGAVRANRKVILYVLAAILVIVIGVMVYKSIASSEAAPEIALPAVMAEPQILPTPGLSTANQSVPTPSNLWRVARLLDPKGGTLVVEFQNTVSGETITAQCQSPHDPAPEVGDIFVGEYKTAGTTYYLLVPTMPGTDLPDLNSKVQRFIKIEP